MARHSIKHCPANQHLLGIVYQDVEFTEILFIFFLLFPSSPSIIVNQHLLLSASTDNGAILQPCLVTGTELQHRQRIHRERSPKQPAPIIPALIVHGFHCYLHRPLALLTPCFFHAIHE